MFNRKETTKFLQDIHIAVHWIKLWRFLLSDDQREFMVAGCNRFLTVAQDIFYQAT